MKFSNPYVLLGVVLALLLTFWAGHHKGYALANLEHQSEVGKLNEAARQREQADAAKISDLAYQLEKANKDADVQINKLRRDLRAGTQRLSVPVVNVCPAEPATAPSGDRVETRAELDPKAADDLVAIAQEGDAAIRQLNACIDAYNEVRQK